MISIAADAVLILIDLQEGFASRLWGRTTNPECESNCALLRDAWGDRPIVVVRHDSPKALSPLAPRSPGNALLGFVGTGDRLVTKTVNSAFYGTPDLHEWLSGRGARQLVMAGIQTNMCVETTARMAGNLGYEVIVPLDATRTFDLKGPKLDGVRLRASAEELMRATAINLHGGRFAQVTTTQDIQRALS